MAAPPSPPKPSKGKAPAADAATSAGPRRRDEEAPSSSRGAESSGFASSLASSSARLLSSVASSSAHSLTHDIAGALHAREKAPSTSAAYTHTPAASERQRLGLAVGNGPDASESSQRGGAGRGGFRRPEADASGIATAPLSDFARGRDVADLLDVGVGADAPLREGSASSDPRLARESSHSQLRRGSAGTDEARLRGEVLQGRGDLFEQAWERSHLGGTPAAPSNAPATAATPDFMSLLAAEEEAEESTTAQNRARVGAPPPQEKGSAKPPLPPGVTEEWRPPSPTKPPTISREQLRMHQELAALQDGISPPTTTTTRGGAAYVPADLSSAYQPRHCVRADVDVGDGGGGGGGRGGGHSGAVAARLEVRQLPADLARNSVGSRASEAVRPPDDDRLARTGVYAPDAARALEAVLRDDGGRDSARVTAGFEGGEAVGVQATDGASSEAQRRGREASARILAALPRGTYVDDVYGLPPLLASLIHDAEATPTGGGADDDVVAATEERREKAIRRLDALWRHLGGGAPSGTAPRDKVDAQEMEKFLRGRT